ncbi:MAG: exodeoxyribonuclease V subunit gamma [Nanoarchaeota archaeon]|nr:exodeoxyribonuclease V subunit gamma [Nanoarchaeota archaeon]
MEDVIQKQEEVKSKDLEYLKILKALMELPFQVGKNLLIDFLKGDYKNKSIINNRLDRLHTFGTLKWESTAISQKIDNLIMNRMIEWVTSDYNKFIKVLEITSKGGKEILNPTLQNKSLNNKIEFSEAEITKKERDEFVKLDDFLNGYNENQKKAIISMASKILCVAGAGSGKTTVLTKRIEFLIRHREINPEKILAITFTRKAKNEMEKRLKDSGIFGVKVNTFNSFCERILKKYEGVIYGKRMGVQGYGDKILGMTMAFGRLGIEMEDVIKEYFGPQQRKFKTQNQLFNNFMNDCFSVMEYFKVTGEKEYNFSKDVEPKDKKNAERVYLINKYLKEHMEIQGLRDYSDQLIDAIKFLKENPKEVPEFEHLLIDEYQDVNAMQVELINLLKAKNIFAVGDPRQSIFGWRGSDIGYILDFEKEYGQSEVIHLTKNYRSSKRIVEFMNKAIKEMGLPDLEHHRQDESKIKIINFENENAEREFVIRKILESKVPRNEIFVLARTNRQLQELSQIMKMANISHVLKTDEVRRPVEGKEGDVTLATIHAIKGLEAEKVFLIGANEQNFPCKATDHPAIEMVKMDNYNKTEEEKRLFYVAISRAKKMLYITYPGKKPTYFINDDMMEMGE